MSDVIEQGGIQDEQVGAVAALQAKGGVEKPAGSCRGGGEGVPVRQPGLREEAEFAVQRGGPNPQRPGAGLFQELRALNQVRQLGVDGDSWNPSGALLPHRCERRVGEWSRRGMRDGVGPCRHDLMSRRPSLDVDHRRVAMGLVGLNACLHCGTVR